MNTEGKLKLCERSAINAWAEGRTSVDVPPWLVYIGVTNICNNRCEVCARDTAMRKDQGVMGRDTFTRIVDELPEEIKKVYLMKQGEPFVNQDLEYFVEYLHKKIPRTNIALHTNGILATEERLEKILPLVDSIGFSISSISRETYRQVHNTDKFETVLDNLDVASSIRMELTKEERPHIFIDYVHQQANKSEEEEEVVEFFRTRFPGLSSVDFHPVYNFQGEIDEGELQIYEKLPYEKFPRCVFPWSSITFCHDGKVSYCFVEPRENKFLGDITKQSFQEIWNGEEYKNFRKAMATKDFSTLKEEGYHCHKCSWLWNTRSQSPRNLNGGFTANDKTNSKKFEDLLELDDKEIFEVGTEYYLSGDIHQAKGCFDFLTTQKSNGEILKGAETMGKKCQKVFDRYSDLPIWQKKLQEEERIEEQQKNKYYPINETGD